MSKAEKKILERWIAKFGNRGEITHEPSIPKMDTGSPIIDNCVCFRLDLKVSFDNQDMLIECKKRLDMRQLGQLLGFAYLWKKRYPDRVISLTAVCEETEPSLEEVFYGRGIRVDVV